MLCMVVQVTTVASYMGLVSKQGHCFYNAPRQDVKINSMGGEAGSTPVTRPYKS